MMAFDLGPTLDALGWTLVHFLWQGALIACLLEIGLLALRRRSPNARYLARCAGLVAMAATPLVTFLVLRGGGTDLAGAAGTRRMHAEVTLASLALPWVVALWSLGVAFFSARLLSGYLRVRRLQRRALGESLPDRWQGTFDRLAEALGVRAVARVMGSASLAVPTVVGWLRPVVLIPARVLTGLGDDQILAVLAHELAHIRRHDYLVNLVQSLLEALLFYHPAVWWVSAGIRTEREYCCDDIAVAVTEDGLAYARALTSLETWRGAQLRVGVSTTGGSLMHRIQRLVGIRGTRPARSALHAGALALAASMGATAFGLASSPDLEGTEALDVTARQVEMDVRDVEAFKVSRGELLADQDVEKLLEILTARGRSRDHSDEIRDAVLRALKVVEASDLDRLGNLELGDEDLHEHLKAILGDERTNKLHQHLQQLLGDQQKKLVKQLPGDEVTKKLHQHLQQLLGDDHSLKLRELNKKLLVDTLKLRGREDGLPGDVLRLKEVLRGGGLQRIKEALGDEHGLKLDQSREGAWLEIETLHGQHGGKTRVRLDTGKCDRGPVKAKGLHGFRGSVAGMDLDELHRIQDSLRKHLHRTTESGDLSTLIEMAKKLQGQHQKGPRHDIQQFRQQLQRSLEIVGDPGSTQKVRPGDTASAIALRALGDAGRLPELAELNRGIDLRRLAVGQELALPALQSLAALKGLPETVNIEKIRKQVLEALEGVDLDPKVREKLDRALAGQEESEGGKRPDPKPKKEIFLELE